MLSTSCLSFVIKSVVHSLSFNIIHPHFLRDLRYRVRRGYQNGAWCAVENYPKTSLADTAHSANVPFPYGRFLFYISFAHTSFFQPALGLQNSLYGMVGEILSQMGGAHGNSVQYLHVLSNIVLLDHDALGNAHSQCLDYCQGQVTHDTTGFGLTQRNPQNISQDCQCTFL